ncbi:MAG: HAD family hydrolase [Deferribacteraceae bacterium]|jgi:FMN phosphatase YigB (HAD superfamily)|nr:HAD family hydrolase [Deferribacteraceae bacterium]
MKRQLQKKLSEYRLVILDMDGTLYYQLPLRLCMCAELVFYYAVHIHRIAELFMLRKFRKSYESGVLEKGPPAIERWMLEKPLRYIALFRDRKLLRLIRRLRENGAKIVIYSDYPVQKKVGVLPDLTADYCFCAADTSIQCLKPDVKGLNNILRITGETVTNGLFIGDRYEKDGKCRNGLHHS